MFSCHLQRCVPLQFLLGEVKATHPLGKSVRMVSWNQEDQKKHNSKLPFHPTNIPFRRADDGEARERWEGRHPREDLSRGDWLFLLSILEGELQASDEVIAVLKAEKTDAAPPGARCGFSGPEKVIRAPRRDSLRAQRDHLQDVYRIPIAEVPTLNQFVEAQRHSSQWMQEQLLEVSRSHARALHRLEEQERSHGALVHESGRLTALLEEDRERWVHRNPRGSDGRRGKEANSDIHDLKTHL
ncbi:Filamin A-interacting protein 1-like [Liparis tanakae]|uniref:Filamin A-interacting protein 1-like n=1 Tax=Liparis tanakae TaxID=230148 RepID=A0A4Z2GN20_9TELE|nr:Filamin A-interacting protein 1-like [Liparis tanakae]